MSSFTHSNRICVVCQIPYRYCSSCSEFSHLEPWHAMFHDGNCRSIFNTAFDFDNGKITKEEAMIRFGQCDLSNKEKFSDTMKRSIDKAFAIEVNENDIAGDFISEFSTENEELTIEDLVNPTSFGRKKNKAKKWAD